MKRKKTPPSQFIVQRLREARSAQEVAEVLSEVRYAGDIKQLAESYGLHYLKSKRMRTRELRQWIIDNHPAAKVPRAEENEELESEKRMLAGIDWGFGGAAAVSVVEEQPDGSLKVLSAEVTDGTRRPTGPDRQGGAG